MLGIVCHSGPKAKNPTRYAPQHRASISFASLRMTGNGLIREKHPEETSDAFSLSTCAATYANFFPSSLQAASPSASGVSWTIKPSATKEIPAASTSDCQVRIHSPSPQS